MQKLIEKIINNKKIFTVVICSLILLILAAVIGISVIVKQNNNVAEVSDVILSADFNEDSNGFFPTAWSPENSQFEHTTAGGIDDSGCLKVHNKDVNDARYELTLNADEDTYYKVTGWVKTEDVGSAEGAAGANISVLNNFEKYEYVYGTEDWKYIEFYGKTAKNQTEFTIALRVGFYSGDNTGTAWFDNINVCKVSDVPENVTYVSFEDTLSKTDEDAAAEEEEGISLDEKFYSDMTKVVIILTIFVLIAYALAYRYARAYDGFGRKTPLEAPCGERISLKKALAVIFVIGIVIRVICALSPMQCSVDVNIFKYWGEQIVAGGFINTYKTLDGSIDYPPLYVYVLFAAAAIKNLFNGFACQEVIYSFLIKLTPIIADCLVGVFIYKICDKKMSTEWKVFAVAAWLLNPVVIIDSAIWGQVDSVLTLFVLITLYYGLNKKFLVSGLWLGLGVMLKPQAIIVAPILFYMFLKYFIEEKDSIGKKFIGLGHMALGFITGAVVPCLPFMFKMGMVKTEIFGKALNIPWIFSLFIGTANHYSYASVNALNFWYIHGLNWVHDSAEKFNITLLSWGMAAIVAICIVIGVFYILYKNKKHMPYVFAGILYFCVTMFGPRMHERYFFPAVAFFAVAYVMSNNRIWLWLYSLLSVFGFLTIAEVLLDLEVGKFLEATTGDYDRYSPYLWVELTPYRRFIGSVMVLLAIAAVVLAVLSSLNILDKGADRDKIWKINDKEENNCEGELPYED